MDSPRPYNISQDPGHNSQSYRVNTVFTGWNVIIGFIAPEGPSNPFGAKKGKPGRPSKKKLVFVKTKIVKAALDRYFEPRGEVEFELVGVKVNPRVLSILAECCPNSLGWGSEYWLVSLIGTTHVEENYCRRLYRVAFEDYPISHSRFNSCFCHSSYSRN